MSARAKYTDYLIIALANYLSLEPIDADVTRSIREDPRRSVRGFDIVTGMDFATEPSGTQSRARGVSPLETNPAEMEIQLENDPVQQIQLPLTRLRQIGRVEIPLLFHNVINL